MMVRPMKMPIEITMLSKPMQGEQQGVLGHDFGRFFPSCRTNPQVRRSQGCALADPVSVSFATQCDYPPPGPQTVRRAKASRTFCCGQAQPLALS